jgi:hypothetical protein
VFKKTRNLLCIRTWQTRVYVMYKRISDCGDGGDVLS